MEMVAFSGPLSAAANNGLWLLLTQWGLQLTAKRKISLRSQEICPSALGEERWVGCTQRAVASGSVSGRDDCRGHSDRLSWAVIRQRELPPATINRSAHRGKDQSQADGADNNISHLARVFTCQSVFTTVLIWFPAPSSSGPFVDGVF